MIERPIIIIGAPRSGTTILRNCLAQHPRLWHLRAESHPVLEGPLDPAPKYESNRCTASSVSDDASRRIRRGFYRRSLNLNVFFDDARFFFTGRRLVERALLRGLTPSVGALTRICRRRPIRLLEKTPENSLRVSFLDDLFSDALFVWNKRRPKKNVDSLVAGWHATDTIGPFERPRFATYDVADQIDIQDYDGEAWKFALVPEWRSLDGKKVADVAAWQYRQCNRFAYRDLQDVDNGRIFEVQHERFVTASVAIVREIMDWAHLPRARSVERFAETLPQVNDTRDEKNDTTKELRYPREVPRALNALPDLDSLTKRMGYELQER